MNTQTIRRLQIFILRDIAGIGSALHIALTTALNACISVLNRVWSLAFNVVMLATSIISNMARQFVSSITRGGFWREVGAVAATFLSFIWLGYLVRMMAPNILTYLRFVGGVVSAVDPQGPGFAGVRDCLVLALFTLVAAIVASYARVAQQGRTKSWSTQEFERATATFVLVILTIAVSALVLFFIAQLVPSWQMDAFKSIGPYAILGSAFYLIAVGVWLYDLVKRNS